VEVAPLGEAAAEAQLAGMQAPQRAVQVQLAQRVLRLVVEELVEEVDAVPLQRTPMHRRQLVPEIAMTSLLIPQ
jgi:hypothetical protein